MPGSEGAGIADVLAAQARLRRFLLPTPLHHAERFGTWLKLENLQRTGSYKVRGALKTPKDQWDRRCTVLDVTGNAASVRLETPW
ncbi:hypothetical protein ABGA94_16760, partial [Stenotrophomonas sp. 3diitr2024]